MLAAELVVRAPPNGYTILLASSAYGQYLLALTEM